MQIRSGNNLYNLLVDRHASKRKKQTVFKIQNIFYNYNCN